MRKRTLAAVLAISVIFGCTGCAKKASDEATKSAPVVAGVPASDKVVNDPDNGIVIEEYNTPIVDYNNEEWDTDENNDDYEDYDTPATTTTTSSPEEAPVTTTTKSETTTTTTTTKRTDTPGMYSDRTTTTTVNTSPNTPSTGSQMQVQNLSASAISVGCLKITWSAPAGDTNKNRDYEISYSTNAAYAENIKFIFPPDNKTTVYMTGLRANSSYNISVTPKAVSGDTQLPVASVTTGHTENPTVIWNFDYEPGWTNCFAGEKASGLVGEPSRSGIAGSIVDPITGTGIRRNKYGDYCCAMGTWYGYVGDRFLITLDNGIQFTTQIADSKGLADDGQGKYHWFGGAGNGKCIIEFIYDDNHLPNVVASGGSWGGYNWNGLNLGANIASIQKINYGNQITY